MKRFILALILGLALGYNWGFRDGAAGEPSVGERILNKFGADKLKSSEETENQRIKEAGSDSTSP